MKVVSIRLMELHGKDLQKVFPDTATMDPLELVHQLQLLERKAARIGLRCCNGPEYPEGGREKAEERVLAAVDRLTGYVQRKVPVFINGDPRGYALKIDDQWMRERGDVRIQRDWGGYGILAPEF